MASYQHYISLDTVADVIPALRTQVRRAHDDAMLQSLKAMLQEHSNSESPVERIRGERNLARLHSFIDSGASKFMDAMPFCIFLQMNDQQYKSGVWNYLGLSVGPVNPGLSLIHISEPTRPY